MRDELVALGKLAEIDSSAREFDVELKELPQRIDSMRSDVATLEALLAQERQQLEAAKQLRDQQATELQLKTEQLSRARGKAAKARNLREADAAEREVDTLRRALKEREEELLRLEETIKKKTASLGEREKQFEEARTMFLEEDKQARARIAELEAKRAEVTHGRDEWAAKVPRIELRRYERRREAKGQAVSIVSEGTCGMCRFALPPQLFIEAQRGETKTICPNCQTVIIFRGLLDD